MTGRKGFTLIELLVVIVIIGILVAIALPNFIKIKDKAKEAEVKQNLHAVQLAIERYAVDNEEGSYPFQVMGGDWTDTYTVWQSWVDQQGLSLTGLVNPTKAAGWLAAPQQRGDSLIMEAYMSSYPQNPFNKKGGTTLLPQIRHNNWALGQINRYVGGRESNKMVEVWGPTDKYPTAWQVISGDTFVHHPFNNPPYNVADLTKTPGGSTPWRSPSGNKILIGNFSFYPRNSAELGFAYNAIGGGAVVGYTLAGYGALRTGGQDVYNRNGNYKGRYRGTNCALGCGYGVYLPSEIPCLCASTNPPSMSRNDGGSDTIIDSVVITLDSGVDRQSKATNAEGLEGA